MWAETLAFRVRYGVASRFRVMFYRSFGMRIGKRCRLERIRVRRPRQIRLGEYNSISEGSWFWPNDQDFAGIRIDVGDRNYFNRDVMLDACGRIQIGSDNMIGPGTYITDSNHTLVPGKLVTQSPMDMGIVVIGNGCWLGAKVCILKDVQLGDGCIVAANSVVTTSFPSNSVIGGNPARLIRRNAG